MSSSYGFGLKIYRKLGEALDPLKATITSKGGRGLRLYCLLFVSALVLFAAHLAWAPAALAQFQPGKRAGLTVGGSVGGLLPITELEDEANARGSVFVRHGIIPRLQLELHGGYGRFNSSDSGTDLGMAGGSLLFSPVVRERWNLFLRGGVGLLRYDWEHPHISPLRKCEVEPIGSMPMVPLSSGVQLRISDNLALEVTMGYTMALGDAVNGVEDGGDDAFWQGMVGLTIGSFGAAPTPMPSLVSMGAPVEMDADVPEEADAAEEDTEVVEEAPTMEAEELPAEVAVEEPPVEMPELMEQSEVRFGFDSAGLSTETKRALDSVVKYLMENSEVKVAVRGHTDSTGPVAYNLKLGMKRAQSVKDYLVSQGVDGERLALESMGESEPISTNFTPEGRKMNRRVEIAQIP
jgi:outer membrane protein OmpA-like peptidoglycan-associated protein